MNGAECGKCGETPCLCKTADEKKREKERIEEGKEALEIGWSVLVKIPRWKMKLIRWFWPDLLRFTDALREYYWVDR